MANTIVDGEKQIGGTDTSKRGYPIVPSGTEVDCHHCDETHVASIQNENVGYKVPGGHKRHNHFTCPNTKKYFAAEQGTRR